VVAILYVSGLGEDSISRDASLQRGICSGTRVASLITSRAMAAALSRALKLPGKSNINLQ